ncbi:MAG: hypothetical protein LBQ27_06260 [Clostridiales bacterium]|nr:hypothetical protein [Clostridiales bacterium]
MFYCLFIERVGINLNNAVLGLIVGDNSGKSDFNEIVKRAFFLVCYIFYFEI